MSNGKIASLIPEVCRGKSTLHEGPHRQASPSPSTSSPALPCSAENTPKDLKSYASNSLTGHLLTGMSEIWESIPAALGCKGIYLTSEVPQRGSDPAPI